VSSAILHSVEVVEKVFVDAVRDEVDNLFHDRDRDLINSLGEAKLNKITEAGAKITIKRVVCEDKTEIADLHSFTAKPFPYAWGMQ
jgi:hypothetical protein